MKQILIAAALLAFITNPADAKNKNKSCVCKHDRSAATVTDHSYDEAYSARWAHMAKTPGAPVSAGAVTGGYIQKGQYAGYRQTATYYGSAQSAAADQPANTSGYRNVALPNVTVREDANTGYQRPSPYMGDVSPSNDGPAKNEYRNINVANTSQPLAGNDGSMK